MPSEAKDPRVSLFKKMLGFFVVFDSSE